MPDNPYSMLQLINDKHLEWKTSTAAEVLDDIRAAMHKVANEFVIKPVPDADMPVFIGASPPGQCSLRSYLAGQCPAKATMQLGARHLEHSECLQLAHVVVLCDRHLPLVYDSKPWNCTQCGRRAAFTEPVEIRCAE